MLLIIYSHFSLIMYVATLFLCVIATLLLTSTSGSEKSTVKSAAIPCVKKTSIFEYGHSFMKKLAREIKLPFSSDLERLTLQLTRPTNTELASKDINEIIAVLNTEYNDPQLLVGLLVKLSRKFAESNICTKIKAVLAVHQLVQKSQPKAQVALSKAFTSLLLEKDEKLGTLFFNRNSIQTTAVAAANVAEIQAVDFLRQYSDYVFDLLTLKSELVRKNNKDNTSIDSNKSKLYDTLLMRIESMEAAAKLLESSLGTQCALSVKEDKSWIAKELKTFRSSSNVSKPTVAIPSKEKLIKGKTLSNQRGATTPPTLTKPKIIHPSKTTKDSAVKSSKADTKSNNDTRKNGTNKSSTSNKPKSK